ncbi:GNAT family N-acetyltransferase [Archangium sp.]|uniref:GNAT family N-acetyltransferase n=1 Tax=Archangium sp. TaxID=1872627 RepID=UPI002D73193F|nr:GNAT family N-acetyltransferase [Archangium sp.]HYO59859.1 GNAT family N-acetyltransferase [Archangium sp.]
MRSALYERFRTLGERYRAERTKTGRKRRKADPPPQAGGEGASTGLDRAAFPLLGEAGMFRAALEPSMGGEGLAGAVHALAGFAAGSGDLGLATSLLTHLVCVRLLARAGTEAQRARHLPRLLSGEWVGAVANTEPRAGTDILALRARVVPTEGGPRLDARKCSITNVGPANLAIVSARLAGVPPAHAVNLFLVETAYPGVHMRPVTDLTGLATSATGNLIARRVTLPADARLGEPGDGVRLLRTTFTEERLLTGVLYLAAVRRCLERGLAHAQARRTFGEALGRHQYIQERLVRMRVAEETLEALLDLALGALARGEEVFGTLSIIKLHGVEAAVDAAQGLIRVLGGKGLRRGEGAEGMLRDLLCLSVFGGTVELHKVVLYNETVKARGRARPPASADEALEVHDTRELPPGLEAELCALVARTFPGEPSLHGRYYYDTRPDQVVTVRRNGVLAGFRAVTFREVMLGGRMVKVAGLGIVVAPEFQRQGLGTLLTRHVLSLLAEHHVELALTSLLSRSAEKLLRAFGFSRLAAPVTYLAHDDGRLVTESMPVHGLALGGSALLEEIEARGGLHLGVGTW